MAPILIGADCWAPAGAAAARARNRSAATRLNIEGTSLSRFRCTSRRERIGPRLISQPYDRPRPRVVGPFDAGYWGKLRARRGTREQRDRSAPRLSPRT